MTLQPTTNTRSHEPTDDSVIVDIENIVLELVSIEDGTLVVDYDEDEDDEPRLQKSINGAGTNLR